MSEKPLRPWVIAEAGGKILAAHCNCMAGLGETCSHVASLLWAIEAGLRARDAVTVTGKKAYWMLPPGVQEVPYAPIQRIKFIGKKSCMSQMARQQSDTSSSSSTERNSGSAIIPAGPDRKRRFLDEREQTVVLGCCARIS